jgi:NADP-dependent 3-hydroxy acid dehydrogenase YdfG
MGEVSYHASKSFLEGFTNTLRHETIGADIQVLILRPGFVKTNFHFDRVGSDQKKLEDVFECMEPPTPEDVAAAAAWVLSQPGRISIKALDIVPTPYGASRRTIGWNSRRQR